jgi:outer membrane protein OmpA-like peptidoglycan-associated protein
MEEIMRPATSILLATFALGFSLAVPAFAQDQIQVFDEPPPLDELRAIFIPDQGPGQSRRIEIPPRDALPAVPAPTSTASAIAAAPAPAMKLAPAKVTKSNAAEPSVTPAAATPPKRADVKPASLPALPKQASNAAAFHINFSSNSDALPSTYRPHLDRIVELMKAEPSLALTIEGHTDAYGNDAYNIELSRRRAVSVMRYLVDHGIGGSRLVAVGKGKSSPLTANPFDSSNRRVQFVSTGQSGT